MRIILAILFCFFIQSLSAQYKTKLTVAQDGSGDFSSIQEAIDHTKSFPDQRITIFVKAGVYLEKVKVHSWNSRLSLVGEDAATTIIRWGDHFKKMARHRNSTFHTPTLWVQGDDFRAENLTIENTAGEVGQAIALAVEADRCLIQHCRILGFQDSLYAAGANTRQHYKNCHIEGSTDFIFGEATALFEACVIHSKSNSFITAASTPQGRSYGFVFLRCRLTADPGVDAVYLGRPWRDYARTAFVHCEMGKHIRPEGWDNWSSEKREKTTFYAEYDNTGPGAQLEDRVPWSHQLSRRESKKYTPEAILQPFCLPEFSKK